MKDKNRRTWNEEQFKNAVKNSKTLTEVAITLGLKASSGNYKTIKKYIIIFNLDTSHFYTKNIVNKINIANARKYNKKITNSELFIKNSLIDPKQIKKRIIQDQLIPYVCAICFINSWLNHELVLQMDHINGDNKDNRLENLRFLCPNCHSQTPTYAGRNMKNKRVKRQNTCIDCKTTDLAKDSVRCMNCYNKTKRNNMRNVDWPSKEKILELIEKHGKKNAAEIIGCSVDGMRKHLLK